MQIDPVKSYLLQLQDSICDALATEDGAANFISDEWQRPEGGGGRSRVSSYTYDEVARRYVEVASEVLGVRAASAPAPA